MEEASCFDSRKNVNMEFKPGNLTDMVKEGREEDVVNYLAAADRSTEKWQVELDDCVVRAAQHNKPGIMKHLLEAGASVGYIHNSGSVLQDPVLNAIFRSGATTILDIFLEHIKGKFLRDISYGADLLNAAVESRNPEFVKRTCSMLQDLNIAQEQGSFMRSPLHTLVECYDTGSLTSMIEEIMDALLKQGFDINCTDSEQNTPLHIAAQNGNMAGVRSLMRHGAEIFIQSRYGEYPWMTACYRNRYDIMRELLQGVDLSEHRDIFESFLLKACRFGWEPAVRYFLDKGVDVNCTDDENRTPLIIAAGIDHSLDVVKYLVSHNHCDVNFDGGAAMKSALKLLLSYDELAEPWFHWTWEDLKAAKIVGCLVQAGADLNIRDQSGHTLLMDSVIYANIDCRDLLLQYEADVNAVARDGLSVLWTAVSCNVYDPMVTIGKTYELSQLKVFVVEDLLSQNIDMGVSRYRHLGQTPLQAAFVRHQHTLCNILLDADCSVYNMNEYISSREWNMDEDMEKVKTRILEMCDQPYSLRAEARLAVLRAIGQGDLGENLHRLHGARLLPKALVKYLGKTIKFNLDKL